MKKRGMEVRLQYGDLIHGSHLTPEEPCPGSALVVLGHGVSNNMDHPMMRQVAEGLVGSGHEVALFNFPFAQEGKHRPDPEPVLVASMEAVANAARGDRRIRLFLGGKSLGARIAARAATTGFQCDGLIFLGFPLHAPERHSETRDELIRAIKIPMLFIQGTRDPYCHLELLQVTLRKVSAPFRLDLIEGGEHSYVVKGRAQREVYEEIVGLIKDWLSE